MGKSKVLIGFVLLCYVLFAVFEFSGYENLAYHMHALIVPLITLIYLLFGKRKNNLFLLFMLFYSASDLMGLAIENIASIDNDFIYHFDYYFGNLLYILAYLFLVVKISKSLNFMKALKQYKVHAVVLLALNIYFLYVLQSVISNDLLVEEDYYFELIYNIVAVVLLPLSLLNYFYRDNRKALYLFLGSLFIVFSEVMNVAYLFIKQLSLINFLSTTLTLLAFYFFYQQSKLMNTLGDKEQFKYID